ncbi:MAG TPA: hypothetical protein ENN13_00370 [Candidatus Altiarchaeales archaeon]|nr:hypothetical protein [Candidatus Altiarchaeales archaeon]
MSKTTDEVRRELTEKFTLLGNEVGGHDTCSKIYMTLFLSPKPLGLNELAEKTGYSNSTICNAMGILEKLTDVRSFKKPGSKKIYYECEQDLSLILGRKFMELRRMLAYFASALRDAEAKLEKDQSDDAKILLKNISKRRKEYEKYHQMMEDSPCFSGVGE